MSILQLEGAYENELTATGEFHANAPRTVLLLPSGERLVLPTELLLQAAEVRDVASQSASAQARSPEREPSPTVAVNAAGSDAVIPVGAEELLVGKAQVETGRVRVRRETQEQMQTVSVPLTQVSWDVEHVPVERVVEAPPEVRQVGDTMIFPLVEERMVVHRELWLREEVHVRRVKTVVEKSADFAVKRDVLIEERLDTADSNPTLRS